MWSCPWKSGTARRTLPCLGRLDHLSSQTFSAGPPPRARKNSSPRDNRRREEWWERRRGELQSQAAPSSRSYSDAVRWQEPNNDNPVLSRVQNTTSKPATDSLSAILQPEPLFLPNIQPKPSPGPNSPSVPLILHHGIKPSQIYLAPTPEC